MNRKITDDEYKKKLEEHRSTFMLYLRNQFLNNERRGRGISTFSSHFHFFADEVNISWYLIWFSMVPTYRNILLWENSQFLTLPNFSNSTN